MSSTLHAFLLCSAFIAIAVLAVFDVIPAEVAQFAPLAVVPFVIARRDSACAPRKA